jgi:TatD DNase family protein
MRALTDSHCHLLDPRLGGRGEEVLARALASGVTRLAVDGTCQADWPQLEALWRRHPESVVPSFGLHPLYVHGRGGAWLEELEGFLSRVPAGVGEVGLDFKYVEAPPEDQTEVFRAQLALARRLGRPVTVHCIAAWEELLAILGEAPLPEAGVVIHGFGRSRQVAERCLGLGCLLSFAGSVLYPDRHRPREALAAAPAERLLVESDAPDLAPPPEFRAPGIAFDSEPANLPPVVRGIAALRGEEAERLAGQLEANAEGVWGSLARQPLEPSPPPG